jgi:type IV secretion system protein VirB11
VTDSRCQKDEWLVRNFEDDMRLLSPYVNDSSLTDIYVNPDGGVITESIDKGKSFTDLVIPAERRRAIIVSAAAIFHWPINPYADVPEVEGVLPDSMHRLRFTGILPPAAIEPAIALRRPPSRVFSLEEYLANGQITHDQYDVICAVIKARGNIIVSGATGSGKTTFTNAVLQKMVEMSPEDRFYIVEDVRELICSARDKVPLFALDPQVSASKLVFMSLRFTPKRIIFGEIRYPKVAFELVTAWNTGHRGSCTTIHANTCASSLARLNNLYNTASGSRGIIDFPEVMSLCVHLTNKDGRRFADDLLEVNEKSFACLKEQGIFS